jgi:predicted ArsR family transcriptional regulator
MSVASQIMAYFDQHGKATRPELMCELDLHEKAVESAIRKLVAKGFVNLTSEKKQLPGHRPYLVYEKGSKTFTQAAFTRGTARIGRPPRPSIESTPAISIDPITLAMNSFFGREAA